MQGIGGDNSPVCPDYKISLAMNVADLGEPRHLRLLQGGGGPAVEEGWQVTDGCHRLGGLVRGLGEASDCWALPRLLRQAHAVASRLNPPLLLRG